MRIAFFGTGDFSLSILSKLFEYDDVEIVGIISQIDKPIGRKQILTPPPVKVFGDQNFIPVYQPSTLKNNTEIEEILQEMKLDFIVVVAYGKIIPQSILDIPKYGSINIHGSILPAYRGASPIQEAIRNGDTKTGLTIMYMSAGMDEGDVLATKEVNIDIKDTSIDIFHKFTQIGPDLLYTTLVQVINGTVTGIPQDHSKATYCKKILKTDGEIDPHTMSAKYIYDLGRAFTPWPGIYLYYRDKRLTLIQTDFLLNAKIAEGYSVGSVVSIGDEKKSFGIVCNQGVLQLLKVKLEGKREMDIFDFVNGNPTFVDYIF